MAPVAAAHDHEFLNGAGLYRIHHFVRQSEDLIVGEAADEGAFFDFFRRFASLGLFDDGTEILVPFFVFVDKFRAGIAGHAGGVEAI